MLNPSVIIKVPWLGSDSIAMENCWKLQISKIENNTWNFRMNCAIFFTRACRHLTGATERRHVTWPFSLPATNRNVYFTRRKLTTRTCESDVANTHFSSASRPYSSLIIPCGLALLSSCGRDAGYKFRGVRCIELNSAKGTCAKPPVNECSETRAIALR